MNILAVIPARGGSKGIPRKNLRMVAGKPLIAWSIEAACPGCQGAVPGAEIRVVVSTDDDDIAAAATRWGAEVIRRPAELATDEAATDPVIVHAVESLKADGWRPDLVVLLQPTVPVRAPGLAGACVRRLLDTGADSLLTAYPLHFVWWRESDEYRYTHGPGASGKPGDPGWRSQCPRRPRRQDMHDRELMWAEDGSVFVAHTDMIEKTGCRLGGHMEVYETQRTVDIDTEEDLVVAEALMTRAVPA